MWTFGDTTFGVLMLNAHGVELSGSEQNGEGSELPRPYPIAAALYVIDFGHAQPLPAISYLHFQQRVLVNFDLRDDV